MKQPLPWKHEFTPVKGRNKRGMSHIEDANGNVVTGSMIMDCDADDIDTHAFIMAAVKEYTKNDYLPGQRKKK